MGCKMPTKKMLEIQIKRLRDENYELFLEITYLKEVCMYLNQDNIRLNKENQKI